MCGMFKRKENTQGKKKRLHKCNCVCMRCLLRWAILLMGCRMRRATPRLSRGVGDPNAVGARHPAAAGTAAEKWTAAHGPFHKTFSYAERKNGSCIEIFQFLCPAIEIFTDFFDAELKMSKNSPIQLITEMIMHAFNKRGFFTVPCRPGFFVRPYPVAVRR